MAAPAKKKKQTTARAAQTRTAAAEKTAGREKLKMTESERRIWSVIMLALAVVMLFMLLIPGQNLWRSAHDFLYSFFGVSSWVMCGLLVYMAFMVALDRGSSHAVGKLIQILLLCMFLCALFFSCSQEAGGGYPFSAMLKSAWEAKDGFGSGWIGVLVGWPLSEGFGKIPSILVEIVCLIVIFALMSGKGILNLIEYRRRMRQRRAERLEAEREAASDTVRVDGFDIPREATASTRLGKPEKAPVKPGKEPRKVPFNTDVPFDTGDEPVPEAEDPSVAAFGSAVRDFRQPAGGEAPAADVPAPVPVPVPSPAPESPTDPGLDSVVGKASADVEAQQKAQDESACTGTQLKDKDYKAPPLSLLREAQKRDTTLLSDELKVTGENLVNALRSFGVETRIIHISCGPAVTRYELQPSEGVRISKITNLSNDIALALAAQSVRIEAPIPGKAAIGIEIPNKTVNVVNIREILESKTFWEAKSNITVALGKDITGTVMVGDLGKMPHLLIAGSTGSGKSVCINSFLISLLYKSKPADVRLLLIDPKQVELQSYNGIPHLLIPVVTDPKKAAGALAWAVNEMLTRYKLFAEHNVRDLTGYNEKAHETEGLDPLPQIVIVIDELADLMMVAHNDVEDSICRLTQMARAAGMHLVIATQRPSVDVITGLIKANVPSRIAFAVASQVDSRTILDNAGAEKLLGRGDMLYNPIGMQKPIRLQGCFVSDHEVEQVVSHVKANFECEYDSGVEQEIEQAVAQQSKEKGDESGASEGGGDDDMMNAAIDAVVEAGMASTSLLQRKLRIGYGRAARIIDEMEERGIVGPMEGSKGRKVLMSRQQWYEMKMRLSDE